MVKRILLSVALAGVLAVGFGFVQQDNHQSSQLSNESAFTYTTMGFDNAIPD